jgi:penicillin-insensitive murein endopeptidase
MLEKSRVGHAKRMQQLAAYALRQAKHEQALEQARFEEYEKHFAQPATEEYENRSQAGQQSPTAAAARRPDESLGLAQPAKPEAERAWLRKVRPWWGHDEHMHVRLRCPSGSPECDNQAALPEGDGCDRLGWWFAKRKRQPEPPPKPDPAPEPKPKPARPLPPPECDAVLAAAPQSGP